MTVYESIDPFLIERFPDIAFHLTYGAYEPYELFEDAQGKINARRFNACLHAAHIASEMRSWKRGLDLTEIEILYIYGIGLGYYYASVKDWLKEKRERMVIFIEEDIAVFEPLAKVHPLLLSDPQVHIRFVPDGENLDDVLEELVQSYPCDRIEVGALQAYRKRSPKKCRDIRLKLLRKTTVISALMSDVLHVHKLFANVMSNFYRLPTSFHVNQMQGQFHGVPAVICGAGPSLQESISALGRCENRALIIAGGSAFTALSAQGILPHLGMVLDPNPDEYLRLKPNLAFEVPIIYGNRVLPDVFATLNGPLGYLRSQTGGATEEWLEERLGIHSDPIGPDLDIEALSVTTLGISLARSLGCNPIILTGVDLAFTRNERYAPGVVASSQVSDDLLQQSKASEKVVRSKDREGNSIHTLVKWVMEASAISAYAKNYPDTLFINATSGGIGFQGLPYVPLEEALEKHCLQSYDLRGSVHASAQRFQFSNMTRDKIEPHLQELKCSLERCSKICLEVLAELENVRAHIHSPDQLLETGRMVILEVDFQEEPAFDCFLNALGPALDRLMRRRSDPSTNNTAALERLFVKWNHYKSAIDNILKSFISKC